MNTDYILLEIDQIPTNVSKSPNGNITFFNVNKNDIKSIYNSINELYNNKNYNKVEYVPFSLIEKFTDNFEFFIIRDIDSDDVYYKGKRICRRRNKLNIEISYMSDEEVYKLIKKTKDNYFTVYIGY